MENTAALYGLIEPVTRKYFGLEMKAKPAQFSQIADVNDVDEPLDSPTQVRRAVNDLADAVVARWGTGA